jgi:hypothetical protein
VNALPDKRAIAIFLCLGVIAILHFAAPLDTIWEAQSKFALYAAVTLAGLAFAFFDLRGGYLINRPYVTRDESPVMFWIEVLVAIVISATGGYKLLRLI